MWFCTDHKESLVEKHSFQQFKTKKKNSLKAKNLFFFSRVCHIDSHKAERQQRRVMRTIFVPSQRSRSPSHNCQSCNKSLCGTNEYGIGNETKLIGMLCQLDSIHPAFHTGPFICEVVHRDTHSLSLSLPSIPLTHLLTLSLCLSIVFAEHQITLEHMQTLRMLLMLKLHRINVDGLF